MKPCLFIPVVDHQLLHSQQGVVADELVFVVHVIHHQLFSTQLLNHPEMGDNGREPLWTEHKCYFSCFRALSDPSCNLIQANRNFLCILLWVAGLVKGHDALKRKTQQHNACHNKVTGLDRNKIQPCQKKTKQRKKTDLCCYVAALVN